MINSTQLDILESDFAEIEALIRQFHPNYVVQLAALTAFAPPEDQHEKYMRMNCHIPSKICDVCQDIGATCFYASTDMVLYSLLLVWHSASLTICAGIRRK
jgi:dTDP-4-dehydrorhamnose reductase